MLESVILLTLNFLPIPNPFCPSPSTGERGLEVRCHGDRPPLPVDLCVCVRVRYNGHVPAAALPELHSQDHHQPARLTIPRPRTRWRTAPPNQSAQQDKGRRLGGAGLGFIVSIGLEPELELNSNHTHYLYSNVFCNELQFFLYEEKGKHHHTLTCSFLSRCLMDWPPLSGGKVAPCSPLQPVREWGCSDLLIVEPYASQFSARRWLLNWHMTCPPSTMMLLIHNIDWCQ